MKNITIALVALFSLTLFNGTAQRTDWRDGSNEINIGVKPFNFGASSLQYKAKMSRKNWMRIGVTDLNFLDGETGVRLGIEKQKNMIGRSRLIYGLEPGVYFDYDRIDNSFSEYNVDLGIPVGVQIHLSKKILLGFEGRPSIGIYESTLADDGITREGNLGTGFDFWNGIRTTLGYRF